MPKDYASLSLQRHAELKGKIGIAAKVSLESIDDLSTYYTPGVAAVSQAIAKNEDDVWKFTMRGNTVAIVSDGSAVLGLGNIGPEAAHPVMAGKALLFKEFANIDSFPIVLDTQDTQEIISCVRWLAPSFGGINLEDISAPRCFEIEAALQDLGIPVMHDDQHGTAVVVLAGLINATSVVGKNLADCRIVLSGAGAAGTAVTHLIQIYTKGAAEVIVLDSRGILSPDRSDLNPEKRALAKETNPRKLSGNLSDALEKADIFIGVSAPNLLSAEMIQTMASGAIIFALANPVPEVMPDVALAAGAAVVATGRSDFPNQVNNVLAFPGIFRGALDVGAVRITDGMLLAAAEALATSVGTPKADRILPSPLEKGTASQVAHAVMEAAQREQVIRKLKSDR